MPQCSTTTKSIEARMGKLTGKVIEASALGNNRSAEDVGPALRRLRLMTGLTQREMAGRLNVQQAAVSKIEMGGDVHLSSVQKYVEALGATLRIDAAFPVDAPLALHIRDAFDAEYANDDQLLLPLLGDEPFRAQRDVVLSIKPQYSDKILDGKKTVELRRRFPVSAPGGTIAYIYSTSPVRAMVGVAEIKDVLKLPVSQIWTEFEDTALIEKRDFDKYFEGLEYGFALLFEDVRTLRRPIPLAELREHFGFEPPQSFLYAKRDLRKALENESAIVSH
jgi:predicted transcriptional regulator/DNA-binding XRE family transcriptional regulator